MTHKPALRNLSQRTPHERCLFWVRSEDEKPEDIRRCGRHRDEHPVTGRGRFENHRNFLSGHQQWQ